MCIRDRFNAAKFGWCPILECRAVTLPRRETRWNLQGCPKLTKRSQPLVGQSSPYCGDMWRYCCLTSFFPTVDTCLSCKDITQQSCGMVPRWRLFGDFLHSVFSESRAQHVSNLHSKFTLRHTMFGSMADIQSLTAEIRRGKKRSRRRKKKPQHPHLLRRAAITSNCKQVIVACNFCVCQVHCAKVIHAILSDRSVSYRYILS